MRAIALLTLAVGLNACGSSSTPIDVSHSTLVAGSATAATGTVVPLTVTLLNGSGSPVTSIAVLFESSPTSGVTLGQSPAPSDASGQVGGSVTSNVAGAVKVTATAMAPSSDNPITATATVTFQ